MLKQSTLITQKISFEDIYVFFFNKKPTDVQLFYFVLENNYFLREQILVPDIFQNTVEEFFGFLEMLEHEGSGYFDMEKIYFMFETEYVYRKIYIPKNPNYIKWEVRICGNRMCLMCYFTQRCFGEYLEKCNKFFS